MSERFKMKQIIDALRCTSTVSNVCRRDCPYYVVETVSPELAAKLGKSEWEGCDCNRIGTDAAAIIQEIVEKQPTITLNDLRDEIYQDAVEHGLWDPKLPYPLDDCCELINDELRELTEAADDYEYKEASMDNFCEELADIVIMCMSIAGLHGIDIDAAVKRKIEINKGRQWEHGKE